MPLDITKVVISTDTEDKNVLGVATITLSNSFVIRDIRIVKGKKGIFLGMPAEKMGTRGYVDVMFPVTREAREHLTKVVVDKFRQDFPDLVEGLKTHSPSDYTRFR